MVIQMCVWEPIKYLRTKVQTAQGGALRQRILQVLSVKELCKERDQLQARVEVYKKLLVSSLECPAEALIPDQDEDAKEEHIEVEGAEQEDVEDDDEDDDEDDGDVDLDDVHVAEEDS